MAMFISDKWKDYELIDASDGKRLERWGGYVTVRPDPQVIWSSPKSNPLWGKADGVYERTTGGGGAWVKNSLPDEWTISYRDLKFVLSPMGFKHTGIFPEQAANWDFIKTVIEKASFRPRVLNLFAYTGGASAAAAKAGGFVCHVDASKGMVARAKRNAEISGCGGEDIRFIVDDCFKFVEREIRRNNTYDAVILDPPSYGRGPKGEKWMLEEHIDGLIGRIALLISKTPLFVILNSYTAGLSPSACGYILNKNIAACLGGRVISGELGLNVTSSGFPLPSGATSRWVAESQSADMIY